MPRRFEEVESAGDVCVEIQLRIADGRPHSGARGEMHDAVKFPALDDPPHRFTVADIHLVNRHVFRKSRDIRALDRGVVEVVKVVHHLDGMAGSETALGKM